MNATTSALVSRTFDRARIAGEANNPDLAAHLRELAQAIVDQDADLNAAVLALSFHRRTADLLTDALIQVVPLALHAIPSGTAHDHIRAVALRFPFLTAKLPPT